MGAFKRRPREDASATPAVPARNAPRVRTQNTPRPRGIRAAPSPGTRFDSSETRRARHSGPARPAGNTPPTLPYTAHRGLVASASLVDVSTADARTKFQKRRATAQGWQEEAWAYYDGIGEIKYAFGLVASTLSRVRLYAGRVDDPAVAPVAADPETQAGASSSAALSRLDSAFGGIPGLLRDAALNLQITGECNLVQIPSNQFAKTPESWDIRSTDELQLSPDGRMMVVPTQDGDRSTATVLPKEAFVARIWRPHPRWSDEPDSSMRGLLDTCAELLLLNKTFRATARSRLNSGMLYLPDGLSVAAQPDPDPDPDLPDEDDPEDDPDWDAGVGPGVLVDEGNAATEDDFEEALLEAMTTPIADEEAASAVVPLIVRGPADLGEKIRLIQFERTFDPALAERADRVLDRIMQGLDVPKDIVQGLANIKYSNAVVIDQSLYTSHIEPLALLICDAITTVYLRPSLRAAGVPEDEIARHVVWYDASDVTTRPNKADDAEVGFQNHAISYETWRRTHNFSEEDAPSPEEIATRLLIEKGPLTPELAEALLSVIAPAVMQKVREANQAASPAPLPANVAEALGAAPPTEAPGGEAPEQAGVAPEGGGSTPEQTLAGPGPAEALPAEPAANQPPEILDPKDLM